MSDYISREALIGKVEKHYCAPCKGQGGDLNGDWCRSCVINSVLEKVRGIPATDVAPVRRGRWIEENGIQICSECSEEHEWEDYRAPYCDTCGARMNKEEANERMD